ncbi:MAG: hypothetical protein H0V31_01970 [Acidobacteria bacterium]|nr:hypothetical protein [Acidobacteriota bacterium]
MKILLSAILLLFLFVLTNPAQCETEPTIENTGKILKELKTAKEEKLSSAADYLLTLKASVKGASWQKKNAEAAVLTVFVDGKYNQDLILFAGEKVFEYQALLGNLGAGDHKISIVLNEARSAPNAKKVKIRSAFSVAFEDLLANAATTDRSILAYIATINAPFIYARPDTIDKFSDIPLITYYEIFDEPENIKKIRYTTIFSNEDGGTQSAALMARWGRITDIEWIYEMRVKETGEILSAIYQGANHETKNFTGNRIFGNHPLLFDATINNNFSVAGCSALRFSPMLVQANLADGSRETVMDNFAWTYPIMAQEGVREGRVNIAKLDANTIDDPRNYLYAEIYSEPENTAINVEAETFDTQKFSSDAGNAALRVNRTGYVRVALRVPQNLATDFPKAVSIGCYATSGNLESICQNVRLVKLVRLDHNYQPIIKKVNTKSQNVKAGERARHLINRF